MNTYQEKIVEYYRQTEHAYRDAWDLDNSMSIHYGYADHDVKSFSDSLLRMNAEMAKIAKIQNGDMVLDAGCGVGGSSIYLAEQFNCVVEGVTLSERQAESARKNADKKNLKGISFSVQDYCATNFPDDSFDIVWGCESICYAENKQDFIREAFRVLKPGGRLVVADGFVLEYKNNDHPVIRKWLDGWQVKFLETTDGFASAMTQTGFSHLISRDITKNVMPSARRLNRFFYLASAWMNWRRLTGRFNSSTLQRMNIVACRMQYKGLKKGLWQYAILCGTKA